MSMLVGIARPGLRAFAVAALSSGALLAGLASGPALADPPQVSQAVFDKYTPASDAYKRKEYGTALKLAKECSAAAKTAYEKQICLNLTYGAAGGAGNFQDAADAGAALLQLEGVPAATRLSVQKSLATIYPRINRVDLAIAMIKEVIRTTGGSPDDWKILANLYAAQRNCQEGMPALDKALAGGKLADEQQLNSRSFCANQAKNVDQRIAVNEELLKRFPKKSPYAQLVNIYETDRKVDDAALFALLRFGFDRDWLDDEHDYVTLANFCLDAGAAAEAQRVLEKGIQKKVVKSAGATEKNGRLLEQAKATAAADKKTIDQADAEAKAGKNGDADVKLGQRYFAMQQYYKAAEALARGLQPERAARVKRPDEANMLLGMALLKVKKNADAVKAFTAAKADPKMTGVARIWLNAAGS